MAIPLEPPEGGQAPEDEYSPLWCLKLFEDGGNSTILQISPGEHPHVVFEVHLFGETSAPELSVSIAEIERLIQFLPRLRSAGDRIAIAGNLERGEAGELVLSVTDDEEAPLRLEVTDGDWSRYCYFLLSAQATLGRLLAVAAALKRTDAAG